MSDSLSGTLLGQEVTYPDTYSPDLLFAISRDTNRQTIDTPTIWHGADIWNAYEMSWLNPQGKPIVGTGEFIFPCDSPCLIESKSLKLYLNSWNQEHVTDLDALHQQITADLSRAAGSEVSVRITPLGSSDTLTCQPLEGKCIDDLDVSITHYQPDARLLRRASAGAPVTEVLTSNLLKSNCPVTGQPDWGSVQISYTGPALDHASLLAYIVSMRQHTEFHERCVEKMFCDLWSICAPTALCVYARYTRRGGLDINPWRSSHPVTIPNVRTIRQ